MTVVFGTIIILIIRIDAPDPPLPTSNTHTRHLGNKSEKFVTLCFLCPVCHRVATLKVGHMMRDDEKQTFHTLSLYIRFAHRFPNPDTQTHTHTLANSLRKKPCVCVYVSHRLKIIHYHRLMASTDF